MLSGTHAARSGGGWITLFALCRALVTYCPLRLVQLEEEQDRAPDNSTFQVDLLDHQDNESLLSPPYSR